MPSSRETALAALHAKLETVLDRTVERLPGIPVEFLLDDGESTATLATLSDGVQAPGDYIMGARLWDISHTVELTVAVSGPDAAARLAAVDALLKTAADALNTEGETLGGAVDQLTVGPVGEVDFSEYGAEAVSGRDLQLTLLYTAATPAS